MPPAVRNLDAVPMRDAGKPPGVLGWKGCSTAPSRNPLYHSHNPNTSLRSRPSFFGFVLGDLLPEKGLGFRVLLLAEGRVGVQFVSFGTAAALTAVGVQLPVYRSTQLRRAVLRRGAARGRWPGPLRFQGGSPTALRAV